MKEVLKWIDDVIKGCQKTIKKDLEEIMKELKKGNFEYNKFHLLLSEIRDNERDSALLSLIKEIILEEKEDFKKYEKRKNF